MGVRNAQGHTQTENRTQCPNRRIVTAAGFTGLTIKTKPDVAITLNRFIARWTRVERARVADRGGAKERERNERKRGESLADNVPEAAAAARVSKVGILDLANPLPSEYSKATVPGKFTSARILYTQTHRRTAKAHI